MNNPNSDAKLVLLDEEHSGRDEMNLAGNPFALLQAASKAGQKVLRREWQRQLTSGKTVLATWEVSGHPEMGLPGPNEEVLYLILLQLSREQRDITGDWPQVVHFSRHNLIERLRWSGSAKEYKILEEAFFRLQAVSIQTRYSFHDPRTGAPMPALAFNLIDSFGFVDEKKHRRETDLPFSWFKWSDVVLDSLRAGNVRSLALDFTLSLDGTIARRLFRLLELLRHARKPALTEVKLDVFSIRDRLGMTAYGFPSKVKEKLAPAIEELISRGYLTSVEYEKEAKIEKAVFRFETASPKSLPVEPPKPAKTSPKRPKTANLFESEPTESDIRADALKCYEIFQSLPEAEQSELLTLAREEVNPIWHDRVGQPDSPMSLGLWKLVAQRYPER